MFLNYLDVFIEKKQKPEFPVQCKGKDTPMTEVSVYSKSSEANVRFVGLGEIFDNFFHYKILKIY